MGRTFGSRIRALREARGLTQIDMARSLGLANSTISQYEADRRSPDSATLQRLSDFFHVTTDFLLCRTDDPRVPEQITGGKQSSYLMRVPLLGTIRAGLPVLAEENWEGEVEIPSDWRGDFALRVSGDSMSWVGIHDGDIAVLRQANEAQHGQIVAAGIEGDTWLATLKFFIRDNGQTVLRAANPEYDDIPFGKKHRIIGSLAGLLKEAPSYQAYRSFLINKAGADHAWAETIETATQLGLSGGEVGHMIRMLAKISKQK